MNWEAIGAVGEVLGAIGVIVSLIYLAAQIRQNTRSVRASTYQTAVAIAIEINGMTTGDPELARVFRVGREDSSSLTPDERLRFNSLIGSYFRYFENLFYQHSSGTLDPALWQSYRSFIVRIARFPGVHTWWGERPGIFSEEFSTFIEEQAYRGKRAAQQDEMRRPASSAEYREISKD